MSRWEVNSSVHHKRHICLPHSQDVTVHCLKTRLTHVSANVGQTNINEHHFVVMAYMTGLASLVNCKPPKKLSSSIFIINLPAWDFELRITLFANQHAWITMPVYKSDMGTTKCKLYNMCRYGIPLLVFMNSSSYCWPPNSAIPHNLRYVYMTRLCFIKYLF